MTPNAPGKAHRKGLTLLEIADMFLGEAAAKQWLAKYRWPDGKPKCPHCRTNNVQSNIKHKTMAYCCRRCIGKPMLSLRTGTLMEGSNLKYRAWAVGIYLFSTNIKSISSMKLHRELGVSQKAAWFMLHRLRLAFEASADPFEGPVEGDETYIGGKGKDIPKHRRGELTGRGPVGKTAVVGAKDRATNQVSAEVVQSTDKATLQDFVTDRAVSEAMVCTDDASSYEGVPRKFEAVKQSVGEYVRGQASMIGVKSLRSMMKRGYYGTHHKMSPEQLNRHVEEFAGRHNVREKDTVEQMGGVVAGMEGKRLKYEPLIQSNGLSSGARVV